MKSFVKSFLTMIPTCILLMMSKASAQGDGPKAWMLGPTNLFAIDAKWINLDQNIVPSGSIFVPEANLKVNDYDKML